MENNIFDGPLSDITDFEPEEEDTKPLLATNNSKPKTQNKPKAKPRPRSKAKPAPKLAILGTGGTKGVKKAANAGGGGGKTRDRSKGKKSQRKPHRFFKDWPERVTDEESDCQVCPDLLSV